MNNSKTPIHQWVNADGLVLIVKCVNHDMTSYKGFTWPKAGPVKPGKWARDKECNSGGLFGWPWGMSVGDGKYPNANMVWLVFSAKPENVINLYGKVKVVPGDDGDCANVIYCGTQGGAMAFTMAERISFIQAHASGSSSATGDRGSSSATGDRGSSSATGYSGSSSATGASGSSSATGDSGSSSATGYSGSSSATGASGSSSATGASGSSSATGYRGSSSATGDSGSSSATGDSGSSSATGYSGSSSATGDRGSSSATGDRGSSSATGYSGSSSATGASGSSSATGDMGAAVCTYNGSQIEIGANASGIMHSEDFIWVVHVGAILIVRWTVMDGDKVKYPFAFLNSKKMKLKEGDSCRVIKGKVKKT